MARDPAAGRYDGDAPRELLRGSRTYNIMLAFSSFAQPGDLNYGMLYVAASDPHGKSRKLDSILGKILRINPLGANSANGRYGIPADNPFATDGDPATLGEIWASGIRVPQRIAWNPANGRLFVADIGEDSVEEISLVTRGADLGWQDWGGSVRTVTDEHGLISITFDSPRSDPAVTYPVVEFDHTDELLPGGVAITGIVIHRGETIPQLEGQLLFGDIVSGEIFYIDADALPEKGGQDAIRRLLFLPGEKTLLQPINEKRQERKIEAVGRTDLRFGVGQGGRIFLLNKRDGVIRVIAGHSDAWPPVIVPPGPPANVVAAAGHGSFTLN